MYGGAHVEAKGQFAGDNYLLPLSGSWGSKSGQSWRQALLPAESFLPSPPGLRFFTQP